MYNYIKKILPILIIICCLNILFSETKRGFEKVELKSQIKIKSILTEKASCIQTGFWTFEEGPKEFISKELYEYDETNNTTTITYMNETDEVLSKIVYKYNTYGQIEEETHTNSSGEVSERITNTIESDKIIEKRYVKGKSIPERMDYKLDNNNRIIEKRMYGEIEDDDVREEEIKELTTLKYRANNLYGDEVYKKDDVEILTNVYYGRDGLLEHTVFTNRFLLTKGLTELKEEQKKIYGQYGIKLIDGGLRLWKHHETGLQYVRYGDQYFYKNDEYGNWIERKHNLMMMNENDIKVEWEGDWYILAPKAIIVDTVYRTIEYY